uniref:Uncharacterized protein n=1 Tax=Nicotiana tabacum TaxID=4097 RepID=A0A1S4BQL6_TOBAC|nr:PREDICTED: uncharacterized protein LOC107810858 [Nicotiana tabacum]
MSNVPSSLTDSSLSLFNLAISSSDPWPFSLSSDHFLVIFPSLITQYLSALTNKKAATTC